MLSTARAYSRASRVCRLLHLCSYGSCFGQLPSSRAAEEIDRAIVRNSEEPRRQRTVFVKLVELPVGFEQRLLNNILPVQDRSGHARAVTMQARSKLPNGFKKRKLTRLEGPGHLGFWLILHIHIYAVRCR